MKSASSSQSIPLTHKIAEAWSQLAAKAASALEKAMLRPSGQRF